MFNKKKDAPTVIGISLVVLLAIGGIIFLLSIPTFGFYGFVSVLDKYNLDNLLKMDFYDSKLFSFIYVILALGAVYTMLMIQELIFVLLKRREVLQITLNHHKIVSFILLVGSGFLLTRGIILNIFQRIHVSNLFLLIALTVIYFIFFVSSDTYRKQEASF